MSNGWDTDHSNSDTESEQQPIDRRDQAIIDAAKNGDVAAVRQWLDDGNDADARIRDARGICAAHRPRHVSAEDARGGEDLAVAGPPRPARPSRVQVLAGRPPASSPRGTRDRVKYHCGRNAVAEMPGTDPENKTRKTSPPYPSSTTRNSFNRFASASGTRAINRVPSISCSTRSTVPVL